MHVDAIWMIHWRSGLLISTVKEEGYGGYVVGGRSEGLRESPSLIPAFPKNARIKVEWRQQESLESRSLRCRRQVVLGAMRFPSYPTRHLGCPIHSSFKLIYDYLKPFFLLLNTLYMSLGGSQYVQRQVHASHHPGQKKREERQGAFLLSFALLSIVQILSFLLLSQNFVSIRRRELSRGKKVRPISSSFLSRSIKLSPVTKRDIENNITSTALGFIQHLTRYKSPSLRGKALYIFYK